MILLEIVISGNKALYKEVGERTAGVIFFMYNVNLTWDPQTDRADQLPQIIWFLVSFTIGIS